MYENKTMTIKKRPYYTDKRRNWNLYNNHIHIKKTTNQSTHVNTWRHFLLNNQIMLETRSLPNWRLNNSNLKESDDPNSWMECESLIHKTFEKMVGIFFVVSVLRIEDKSINFFFKRGGGGTLEFCQIAFWFFVHLKQLFVCTLPTINLCLC